MELVIWARRYYPLLLILAYLLTVTFISSSGTIGVNWQRFMQLFMAGFFLIFSAFKLLDLKGFANAYAKYDLLAKQWPPYGYIYPFLELGLGLLFLLNWFPISAAIATILLMGFSSLGVIRALTNKESLRCACLGVVLNVPMSNITLTEDLLMVVMAIVMLFTHVAGA